MKNAKLLSDVVFTAVVVIILAQVCRVEAQTSFTRIVPPAPASGTGISPETQQLFVPVVSMIDANTFFIGRIDLTKIDPETTAADLKTLAAETLAKLRSNKALAESLDGEGLAGALQEFTRGLDTGTVLVQSKLDELRSLGCNEIYFLANSKIMTVSALQVVCPAPAQNLAKLEKALTFPEGAEGVGWVFQHDGDKLIANLITPFSTTSMDDANVGNRVAFQHRLIRPMLRPELAAGLERIKNAPVQLVFAPDGVVRGMMQLAPIMAMSRMYYGGPPSDILFSPMLGSNIKIFDEGVRWVAIGLDPARPVLAITIQSKSPEAAQELHDMFVLQKTMASAGMVFAKMHRRNNNRYGYDNDNMMERIASGMDFAMLFLPNVQGDRLQLTIDEKRLSDTADLITNTYTNVILPSRESAHKMQCANNMKQIMLALHTYHDAYKAFPAPYRTDKDGKPTHSWRVALLPYIEQAALYDRMAPYMNEPWDSENNKQFHNINIPQYQCPAAKNAPGMTNYSVVVGKMDGEKARELGLRGNPVYTAFPEPNKWNSMASIADGTSNTIAIVERKEPVCWMDPSQEITLEDAIKLHQTEQSKVGSAHKGGINVALCDGSVQFMDLFKCSIEIWKALLTANGGESRSLY
ncbi:MAG: DUF1559 domain-containing protein [Planctomycetaceae bacterium]|nr:DUF1559 domain-containing protein [Planctomycetaceae bacterium]